MADKDKKTKSGDKPKSADSSASQITVSSHRINPDDVLPPAVVNMGFTLGPYIGSGQFSKVYKVSWTEKPDQELVVKWFKLTELDQEWKEKCLKNEMKVMKQLSIHQNIVKSFKYIKTRREAFIIMEFAKNGNIANKLEKQNKPFKESTAKKWFAGIMNAVSFAHSKGIAHRDLKLENFLLDAYENALLTDFGFSCSTVDRSSDRIMKGTQCGTAAYMAPEVHALLDGHAYDAKAADVYSMGVCLFEMINFFKPFGEDVQTGSKDVIHKQRTRNYKLNKLVEKSLSKKVKDLIHKLLEPDPNLRITAQQVLEQDFVKD